MQSTGIYKYPRLFLKVQSKSVQTIKSIRVSLRTKHFQKNMTWSRIFNMSNTCIDTSDNFDANLWCAKATGSNEIHPNAADYTCFPFIFPTIFFYTWQWRKQTVCREEKQILSPYFSPTQAKCQLTASSTCKPSKNWLAFLWVRSYHWAM